MFKSSTQGESFIPSLKSLWTQPNNIGCFRVAICPTLADGYETWPLRIDDIKKLVFDRQYLRLIPKVTCVGKMLNDIS